MTSEQFCDLWKILEEFNFEELIKVPSELKCVKCGKIARNACLVPCECLFCLNCIEKMRAEGLTSCIGSTVECKNSVLSNIMVSMKMNRKISNLIVKCHQQDCSTECELIKMVDHLRLCSKTSVKCLFHEFGCLQGNIAREQIQNHFASEQERHSQILFDIIGSLRNEINENSEKMKKSEDEISILKESLTKKDEEIRSIKGEIESIKIENGQLKKEFGRQLVKMKSEINTDISSVTTAYSVLLEDLLQKDSRDERSTPPWTSLSSSNVRKSFDSVDQSIANVLIEWQIDKIVEHKDLELLFSPTFSDDRDSYKMRLIFQKIGKLFQISFQDMLFLEKVNNGITNSKSQMKATVQIMNKAKPLMTRNVTKICTLKEYTSANPSKGLFEFNMDDLQRQGLLQGSGCIVKFMANYLT